jgi:putative peptidoglycan lipid II flippase
MVPLTLGLVVFSQPLIRIVFQRGAFTAEDTKVVSRVLVFLSLQIPFYILVILGIRLISALKRNSLLMVIAGVNMTLNVILNLILMRYAGVAGIALSTSCAYLVSCVLVYASISRSLRRVDSSEDAHGKSTP